MGSFQRSVLISRAFACRSFYNIPYLPHVCILPVCPPPPSEASVSFTITSSELYIVTLFKIFSPYPTILFFYSICSGSIVFQLELFLTLHPPKSPAPLWCCFLFLSVLHMPCSLVITCSLATVSCDVSLLSRPFRPLGRFWYPFLSLSRCTVLAV